MIITSKLQVGKNNIKGSAKIYQQETGFDNPDRHYFIERMKFNSVNFCIGVFFFLVSGSAGARPVSFDMVTRQTKVCIVYAVGDHILDEIAANLLARDIQRVSGYLPKVYDDISKAKGNVIIIGTVNSKLISSLHNTYLNQIKGKWECYSYTLLTNYFKNINNALIIAGSDSRGTAYGVFSISEKIGVSPWYWWADANPVIKNELSINIKNYASMPPSVKFRGIFINDEDFALQPWAAKTFEPETGDIGPKTYTKVFELLLRLKANMIWPAMHPSTKPFYTYPGNKKAASDYEIVIGSSHAEPMLRNNVGEWDEKTMGAFNYVTNQQGVYKYWEDRVKASAANNVIYSIGMRGVHDSPIEGAKGNKEILPLLERIFTDQRELFRKYINPDVSAVPQAFTPYKEVLDIYANGLKVPDDVTLIWPDDNYGYIQRLDNEKESQRKGGSGVYYHTSYWGRPHDYLWLSTTHPALIREEMTKAYQMDAKDIWVLNVGDIKPDEYNIQLFMDMAYNIKPFNNPGYSVVHLKNWVSDIFGKQYATAIGEILWKYYDLAFERKPEFMGWSQTEPTTPTKFTAYNHTAFGDQGQQRIDSYSQLEKAVADIGSTIATSKKDAFYELVEYPVDGAALMNKKFLYRDKAYLYASQGRLSGQQYTALSKQAYDDIIRKTNYYNTQLAGGKWNGIMVMNPRKLPVYDMPSFNLPKVDYVFDWQVLPEGYPLPDSVKNNPLKLPAFDRWARQKYFIDVYLSQETKVNYVVVPSANWIKIDKKQGQLLPDGMSSQQRLWVEIDWAKTPVQQKLTGSIIIKSGNKSFTVEITAYNRANEGMLGFKGFVTSNDYIAINASSFTSAKSNDANGWAQVNGLGSGGSALEALPLTFKPVMAQVGDQQIKNNPSVSYDFYTFNAISANLNIYTLPTYPLNQAFEMRYAVSLDGGPLTIQNFKTVGRSEEWKNNVLSNSAVKIIKERPLNAGKHRLTIYMIDPGVIIDRILIDLGMHQPFYGALPETKRIK
jgi:hypothetical protein